MVRTRQSPGRNRYQGLGGRVAEALWGGSKRLKIGQTGSMFEWREEDSDETWDMTVTVGPVYVSPIEIVEAVVPIDLVGRVKWGNGAGSAEAEFDIGQGVQFSVNASFVEVSVTYQLQPQGRGAPAREITVQGFLTPGTPPAQAGLYRTIQGTVPDAGALVVPVPRFARRVRFYSPVLAPGGPGLVPASWQAGMSYFPYDEATEGGNELASINGASFQFAPGAALELPNNSRGVRMTNTTGGDVDVRSVFELEL